MPFQVIRGEVKTRHKTFVQGDTFTRQDLGDIEVHRREQVLQSYINRRRIMEVEDADQGATAPELPETDKPKHIGFGRWAMPDGTTFKGSKEEMLERLAQ